MSFSWDEKNFGAKFLGEIKSWMRDNLIPNDIFSPDELKDWIKNNFDPDDVFDLEKYGYRKEE